MKTIASLTVLVGSTLLVGADAAVAQSRWSRSFSRLGRIVISEPTYAVSRPVVGRSAVTYGGFSHVDDLAIRMEQLARDVCWEMHLNYSHNPDFTVTYAEAYEMLRQAKYIHQEVHHGHRSEIVRVVGELDRLFHHVEDDIRTWRPSRGHFLRHGHGHGHGHGSLFDKMEELEETLHHLMQDVGATSSVSEPPPPSRGSDPPLPSRGPISLRLRP